MPAISSTFKSNEPRLAELLEDIHEAKLQLPDFQRPWVWDDVHIRSLIASVSQAYPIGAVMLLQTGGQGVRFRPRLVQSVGNTNPPEPELLILDGQQRLTSLYTALRSNRPVPTKDEKKKDLLRLYFLDIERCLDPDADRLDAVVSLPPDKQLRSDFGRKVDLDVSTREQEFELGLVPLSVMLDPIEFPTWRTEFMQHFGMDKDKMNLINEFEREVYMRFQQFKVPVIELLRDTPKEAVCQVFEKVNTGGVALTVFELITATFAADDYQLRDDWDKRKERLKQHPVLKGIDGTDFLQCVTLLASHRTHAQTGKAVSCKRKDILNLKLEAYKAGADDVEEGFIKAARLLNRLMVFDSYNLPYRTQLIPLATVCAQLGPRFETDKARQALTRWYWCGVFGEMYGGANETRFAMDMVDLCGWILDDAGEPRSIRDANFAPVRLLTLQSRLSAAYKGMFALMVQEGSQDFLNGDPISHTQGFSLPVDIHHIFPKAWCERQGIPRLQWNSIVNKAPLTARTNRILSGHAPSQCLGRIVRHGEIDDARLDAILPTHFIDSNLLRSDEFQAFLRDRAGKLLDAIEKAMGKRIQGRTSEETEEAFGGPVGS